MSPSPHDLPSTGTSASGSDPPPIEGEEYDVTARLLAILDLSTLLILSVSNFHERGFF